MATAYGFIWLAILLYVVVVAPRRGSASNQRDRRPEAQSRSGAIQARSRCPRWRSRCRRRRTSSTSRSIFLIGIVLGFILGSKATRDAIALEQKQGRRTRGAHGRARRPAGAASRHAPRSQGLHSDSARRARRRSPYNRRMPNFEFSDEEKQLVDTARDFARKEIVPVAGELDEHGTFPADICKKAWETGLMNCEIPEAVRRPRPRLPGALPGAGGDLVRLHRRQHDAGRQHARDDADHHRRHRRAEEGVPRAAARQADLRRLLLLRAGRRLGRRRA